MVERSDTSCNVHPRAVFMTVFALHPEAIIPDSNYKDHGYFGVKSGVVKKTAERLVIYWYWFANIPKYHFWQ